MITRQSIFEGSRQKAYALDSQLVKVWPIPVSFIMILISNLFYPVFSQEIRPISPSADLVDSRGNTSMDYSTGIMSYHIPLFTIEQDGFKFPIGLTYTADGIKVEEDSGALGYGWTLNTGVSTIVRTMRGTAFDEDQTSGILRDPRFPPAVSQNKMDSELDVFQLNIMGKRLDFFLARDSENRLVAQPFTETSMKVTCNFDDLRQYISGWTVVDENGNIFQFESSAASGLILQNPGTSASFGAVSNVTWVLSNIQVLNKGKIEFVYENVVYPQAYVRHHQAAYNPAILGTNLDNAALKSELNRLMSQLDENTAASLREQISYISNKVNDLQSVNTQLISDSVPSWGYIHDLAIFGYMSQLTVFNQQLTAINVSNQALLSQIQSVVEKMFASKQVHVENGSLLNSNFFADKLLKEIRFKNGSIRFELVDNFADGIRGYTRRIYNKITYERGNNVRTVFLLDDGQGFLKKILIQGEQEYQFDYYGLDTFISENSQDYWGFYNGKVNNGLIPSNPTYNVYKSVSGQIKEFNVFPITDNPETSIFTFRSANDLQSDSKGTGDRRPDATKSFYRSLKSVRSNQGYNVNFEYEGNEVYIPNIDENVPVGGIRLKSVETSDGQESSIKRSYLYKFPLVSNSDVQRSTGAFEQWGRWSFVYPYKFGATNMDLYTFSRPIDLAVEIGEASNNGVYYHYVEEKHLDGSSTGYKYPAILGNYTPQRYSEASLRMVSLGNTLLAKIDYDEKGKIVKVVRNQYYWSGYDANRISELALLANKFSYVVNNGVRPPGSITNSSVALQYKKHPLVFYAEDVRAIQNNRSNTVTFTLGSKTYSKNINALYGLNFMSRTEHYSPLPLGRFMYFFNNDLKTMPLPLQQQEFLFGDYNTTQAYQASNFPGLPDERAYLYERLINAVGQPHTKTTTTYSYGGLMHVYPTRVEIENSDGQRLATVMKYPQDYVGLTAADVETRGISNLLALNVVAPTIEKSTFTVDEQGKEKLLSSTYSTFKSTAALVDKVMAMEIESPLSDFSSSSVKNGALSRDSRYKNKILFNQYDNNGNPVEIQKQDGAKEISLWGYQGQYKVASIVGNSSYSTVQTLVNQDKLNRGTSEEISAELAKLRTALISNTGQQLSTSTYLPHIGVESETDPSGRKTSYTYNLAGDGRLNAVYNHQGSLLEAYQYSRPAFTSNYSNTPMSRNFVRASDGVSVPYVVPAGTYLSIVSQAQANRLASDDISKNGQAYVNNTETINVMLNTAKINVTLSNNLMNNLANHTGQQLIAYILVYILNEQKRVIGTFAIPRGRPLYTVNPVIIPADTKGYYISLSIFETPSINPGHVFKVSTGASTLQLGTAVFAASANGYVLDSNFIPISAEQVHTLIIE